jgi:hypothetical protein
LPAYLRGAGKVAEIIGHQHHDVFWDPTQESCIFYLNLAHTLPRAWCSLVRAASPVAAQWLLMSPSEASQQAVSDLMETSGLDGLLKLANTAGMQSTRAPPPVNPFLAIDAGSADTLMQPSPVRAELTTLPKMDNCTTLSLIPKVLVTRFAASTTHGQLSAAKEAQPQSHALISSN